MKRAGLLVCANGLGHFRRVVQVAAALREAAPGLALDVFCAPWQQEALRRWAPLQRLARDPHARFRAADLYPRWTTDRAYYRDERLLHWHAALEGLELEGYDLVLADNLVEVLAYRPDALLMGSFFWHDVYAAYAGDEPVVAAYRDACEGLLARCRPPMILNRYFAMPSLRARTEPVEVGMLPAVRPAPPAPPTDGPRGLLFVGGTNREAAQRLGQALAAPGREAPGRWRLYVDRRLAALLPAHAGVAVFDFDEDSFERLHAVVARPGMGIVTDCIATRTPMFGLPEPHNAEMAYNLAVLEALGLGRPVPDVAHVFDLVEAYFARPDAQAAYRRAADALDRDGLPQTVRAIRQRLASPQRSPHIS